MAKRRPKADWEAIRREWRANQLSICEIARQHGISDAAIHRRRKKDEAAGKSWGERDLSAEIRRRVRAKVSVSDEKVRDRNARREPEATDEEIIERFADRGAQVQLLHRKDIAKLRQLEQNLIDEIDNNPTKLYITQYQGEIVEKVVALTAAERAAAAANLAQVQHKRIALERQAFNLDDDSPPPSTNPDNDVTVNRILAAAVGLASNKTPTLPCMEKRARETVDE